MRSMSEAPEHVLPGSLQQARVGQDQAVSPPPLGREEGGSLSPHRHLWTERHPRALPKEAVNPCFGMHQAGLQTPTNQHLIEFHVLEHSQIESWGSAEC